jgi:hypothetical protein
MYLLRLTRGGHNILDNLLTTLAWRLLAAFGALQFLRLR